MAAQIEACSFPLRREGRHSERPDPDGGFALHQALRDESAARTEYPRILRIFNELMREGMLPDEEPGLFLVSREMGGKLYRLSAMGDEEDQETPFQKWTPNN